MQVKKTPWETRNLGVKSSIEYYVGINDLVKDSKEIWNSEYEYQVLHIDSGNVEMLLEAQNKGFRVIEMNIQLRKSLDIVFLPDVFRRYEQVLSYRLANKNEIEDILDIVRVGEMFITDKVALDPLFGKKKSGERYAFWSEDILESGAVTVLTLYKEQPIGFEIYTEEGGICTNFIGGVFPEYANKGLGFAPLFTELLSQKARGNKAVITGVSSNNLPVLRLHEMLGFKIDNMSYSLVKHI